MMVLKWEQKRGLNLKMFYFIFSGDKMQTNNKNKKNV